MNHLIFSRHLQNLIGRVEELGLEYLVFERISALSCTGLNKPEEELADSSLYERIIKLSNLDSYPEIIKKVYNNAPIKVLRRDRIRNTIIFWNFRYNTISEYPLYEANIINIITYNLNSRDLERWCEKGSLMRNVWLMFSGSKVPLIHLEAIEEVIVNDYIQYMDSKLKDKVLLYIKALKEGGYINYEVDS